jgi:poly-gamma-glutamate synthesis protein (capsule biosynthesis protein)
VSGRLLHVSAAGDVMLGDSSHFMGRGGRTWIERRGVEHPLSAVRERLADCDLFVFNLESPLAAERGVQPWERVYRGAPESAQGLRAAPATVVTTSNNHVREHGPGPLAETAVALEAAGLRHAGFAPDGDDGPHSTRLEIDGRSVSVHAACLVRDVTRAPRDPAAVAERLLAAVREDDAATVLVSIHWGDEYVTVPSVAQRELGRALIDAGAAAVLGHHPHVLQPVERYEQGLIAYSLGNFVFDQRWTRETTTGGLLELDLDGRSVRSWRFTPTRIEATCRPVPAPDDAWALAVIDGPVETDDYAARRAAGARRHRVRMKTELLQRFWSVGRDTWAFLLLKRWRRGAG